MDIWYWLNALRAKKAFNIVLNNGENNEKNMTIGFIIKNLY